MAEYADHDDSRRGKQAQSPGDALTEAAVDPADLTEGAFLAYVLEQLRSGQWPSSVRLSAADLAAIEAEPIGEHISRYPFLY